MTAAKRLAGIVLLVSFMATGALLGCDGNGGRTPASPAAIANACNYACQCGVQEGFITAGEEPACISGCTDNLTEEGVTASCTACIQRVSCDQILTSDACDLACSPPPESDGGAPGSSFSPF